jgi:hypothetical protein
MSVLKDWIRAGRTEISLLRPTKTADYIGWPGHHNLGDEALYYAIRDAFRPLTLLHKPSPRVLRLASTLGIAPHYAFAILGGGTLIGELGYLGQLERAMPFAKSTIVFGTGVEDPTFWTTRDAKRYNLAAWKEILERCSYIGVRGPRSHAYLQQIGIQSDILGDPVSMFVQSDPHPLTTDRHLGLNLGVGSEGMFSDEKTVFATLSAFAKKMLADGWKITLYVVWPKDLAISRAFAADVGIPSGNIRRIYHSPAQFMAAVRRHPVFVGFKLHGVVLSYCAGVPAYMIEYRPKCRDFMESIGAEAFITRADQLSLEQLLAKVDQLQREGPALIQKTTRHLQSFRDKQIATAQRLIKQAASA